MKTLDRSLLKEVQFIVKEAYAPPPYMNPEVMEQMQQPMTTEEQPQGDPMEMVYQAIQQGMAEGVPPETIMQKLVESGVPQEVVMQAFNEIPADGGMEPPPEGADGAAAVAAPPPSPEAPADGAAAAAAPSSEPLDIDSMVEEEVKREKKRVAITPEDRLLMVEKKLEIVSKLVQDLVNGMAPKTASDKGIIQAYLEALNYDDVVDV